MWSPQGREGGNLPGEPAFRLLDQAFADSTTPSRVVRRDEAAAAVVLCLEKLSDARTEMSWSYASYRRCLWRRGKPAR